MGRLQGRGSCLWRQAFVVSGSLLEEMLPAVCGSRLQALASSCAEKEVQSKMNGVWIKERVAFTVPVTLSVDIV